MTSDEIIEAIWPEPGTRELEGSYNWVMIGAILGSLLSVDTSEVEIDSLWANDGKTWLIEISWDDGDRCMGLGLDSNGPNLCRYRFAKITDDAHDEDAGEVDATTIGPMIRSLLPPPPEPTPEHVRVILQVRPAIEGHPSWPEAKSGGEYEWASIDPFDPPGWTLGTDQSCTLDSLELWEETGDTLDDHIEMMKGEWLGERGPDEDGEDEGYQWEFRLLLR